MHESPLAIYRGHLAAGRLAYQYDPATARAVFPPRVLGPGSGTGAAQLEWRISAGLGTIHAVTIVHPRDQDAYNVVLVDMDEGFRLMSRVEGDAAQATPAPAIGMRVRVRAFSPPDGGEPYPVFDLQDSLDSPEAA
ncbi:Zn-ribbon domain-containing OB-fold protein [Bordetella bronchialis]|uniref:ChsH2 C-terminal OB-fold domain-containing protein n=1 Tax=Bordetella bronchialis TaxID=463025 RepID=A0ABN4R2C4_9BORD|nr:OB-fold domain-containing protein [Bordetella bronchialis]ANN65134.1 hypothetical protein BAU06_01340 [Bordetella bronchialis]